MIIKDSIPGSAPVELANLRIRWINCQNFEIQLPNGTRILTDPYVKDALEGCCKEHATPFQVEDYEGADYIIVQHTHFDHDFSCGDVYKKFGGKFLVHEAVAYEFGKCFDIPYINIIPYATEGVYRFKDFTLHTFPAHHSTNKWIESLPSETPDGGQLNFGISGHEKLEPLGSMFNVSFVLTTPENYRIAFITGLDLLDAAYHLNQLKPNLLLKQLNGTNFTSDREFFEASGAQLMIPMHYERLLCHDVDVKGGIDEINRQLAEDGYYGRAFYLQRYEWYTLYSGICPAEQ